jgi:hypothetical protein
MTHELDGVVDQGQLVGNDCGKFNRTLSCHRADADTFSFVLDIRQVWDAVEINEDGRGGEPEVHHRDQALAAGEHTRVGAIGPEQRQGRIDRSRSMIFKARRLHYTLSGRAVRVRPCREPDAPDRGGLLRSSG